MSIAWKGRRQYHKGAYHYDMRYGTRLPISEMEWQRGLLIESSDMDTMLIGDREQAIIKCLSTPSKELQPDSKLQQPIVSDGDDFLFTP